MRASKTCFIGAAIALLLAASPVSAVDEDTSGAPDLTAVRAKIKAENFKEAAADLTGMVNNGVQHADVYSLLGFSLRKSGDLTTAATFYTKALETNPEHRGALEYQGEMFVQIGQIDRAKQNLQTLAHLCPQGCEEREDLEEALEAAEKKTN